jgi:hypothetical protein
MIVIYINKCFRTASDHRHPGLSGVTFHVVSAGGQWVTMQELTVVIDDAQLITSLLISRC